MVMFISAKKDILIEYQSLLWILKVIDFIKLYCDKTDGFTHFKEENEVMVIVNF